MFYSMYFIPSPPTLFVLAQSLIYIAFAHHITLHNTH